MGGIVEVSTASTTVNSGVTTTIVSIANTYTSAKVLVNIDADINESKHEFVELNIVHDGTNVELLEYGRMATGGFAASFWGLKSGLNVSTYTAVEPTPTFLMI